MAREALKPLLPLLVAAALVACNGSSSPTSVPTAPDLEGEWFGELSDATGTAALAWLVTSDGNRLVGLALLGGGDVQCEGTMLGQLSGASLSFSMSFPPGACPAPLAGCRIEYLGLALATSTTIEGMYNADDSCRGAISDGRIELRR